MLSESAASAQPHPELPVQGATLLAAIQILSAELDTVRQEAGPELSARLVDAEAELDAIHEELRQQQEEIEGLLSGAGSSRSEMLRRFLASLPLATVMTNSSGIIMAANAAAHSILRASPNYLPGKPIFSFVAQDDRRRLRSMLSRTAAEQNDEPVQISATLTPRNGPTVPCRLALARDLGSQLVDGDPAAVFWVVLPDHDTVDEPASDQQLEALTRLCRLGADGSELRATLNQVVRLCLQAVPAADEVSLLVGDPAEPTLAATSSVLAQQLDGLQHARGQGPIIDAYRSRRPMALDGDAVTGHPGLAGDPQAASLRSVLSVPLLANDVATGVLTVYTSGPTSTATLSALRQLMPFVEAAQSLIRDTEAQQEMLRTQQQLEAALLSRAVIDQAKGMIMVTLKCSADEAFAHLVRTSSTRHAKVRDVAQAMVDEFFTPPVPTPASPSE